MKKLNYKSVLIVLIALSAITSLVLFFMNIMCGVVCLCLSVCLCTAFGMYEKTRLNTVENINNYLSRVCSGDYSLAISDNTEGEFSILKNNIYKVVVMLKSTNEELSKEKMSLANSLADITHQLKTPLTSITVMTDLLKGETDENKRSEFVNIIENQIDKMNWLTGTLLKLSKLDAGAITFNSDTVKISDVVENAVKPFLLGLDLKNISLKTAVTDFTFTGDLPWTTEAVKNIIKNCIEHTETGGTLSVSTNITNLYDELVIEDTGKGIEKEDLPHIFERFYHGKNAFSDSVGIGLNLSKEILSKERAKVEAQSEIGVGSTFRIKFYKTIV